MNSSDHELNETMPLKSDEQKDNELQEEPVIVDLQQKETSIDHKTAITEPKEPKDPNEQTLNENVNEYNEDAVVDQMITVEKESIENDMNIAKNEDDINHVSDLDSTNVENEYVDNTTDKINETTQQHVQQNNELEATTQKLEREETDNEQKDVEIEETDNEQKPLILSEKTDEQKDVEIDVIIHENTETNTDEKASCGERFIKNWAKLIYIVMVIVTLSLVGVLIGINKPDEEAGIIVGLVCFNMVLSGILMPFIGILFVKAWTKNTWWLIFFIVYIAIIFDVIAFGIYLKEVQIPLILYGVIKILSIFYAFMFAKIDGKHFIPSIISGYITIKFIKYDTKLYKLIPLYLICLLIQICMFSIGCMAFIIDGDNVFGVIFIIALILFIWLINTPRHFLSYMTARVLAKYIRESEKENTNENDDHVIKLAFKDTYNKFMTITIGSFLVTTTPLWYFITNLMTGLKIVAGFLVLCCLPCTADDDEDGNACTCVASLITCVGYITYGIAWIARKISKWTLRVTAKLILISAGFLNNTFWDAIKIQNQKIKKETKDTFGSDMLFLDNVTLSNNTHLCILISSIGAWLTYLIKPEACVICWIAGYCACRTMFEMVDVILLTFLIAWFIEPRIIYNDERLFEDFKIRARQMIERLFPNENEEFYVEAIKELIHIEVEEVGGLQKTTDQTHITNIESTKTTIIAAQETKQIVHKPTEQIMAQQQNQVIIVNQQITEIDNTTNNIVNNNNSIQMTNNNTITYENNNDDTNQIR